MTEVIVQEGGLDQRLAVVEAAVDLQGGDVLPQGRELALLDGTDAPAGIQDEDMRSGDTQEAVGDGASRVTGRGDEDIDIPLAAEMAEEPGHEPGADVLESQGRPMEELQGVDSFFHRHGRAVER